MPDEQDTPTPEPSPEDASEASEPQANESQEDAQQPEAAESSEPAEAVLPTGDEAEALAAAMDAVNQVQGVADSAMDSTDAATAAPGSAQGAGGQAQPFTAPELSGSSTPGGSPNQVELLSDVHMDVRIELGRTRMFVEDVLKLGDGAVVELDKLAGDPVDVFVNERRVARGEVLVLNDMFCVRINEIVDITQSDD